MTRILWSHDLFEFVGMKTESDQMKTAAKLRAKLLVEQKYDRLSKPVKNHTTKIQFFMLIHLFQIADLVCLVNSMMNSIFPISKLIFIFSRVQVNWKPIYWLCLPG